MLYVAIRLAYAVKCHQRREACGWAIALGLYAIFIAWHFTEVQRAMPLHPQLHTSWVQFGAMRFVLDTLRMNAWLTLAPWWIVLVALIALLLGAWRATPIVSLPVVVYLAAFAIIGQPFNWYWGWVPGMLFPLAWAEIDLLTTAQTANHRTVAAVPSPSN